MTENYVRKTTYPVRLLWSGAGSTERGYCPDLFAWGGVCHAASEEEAYGSLRLLVQEEVAELRRAGKDLPPASTRPMREVMRA